MMPRRRVVSIVARFAKWAWQNRKTAAMYELTVIREGQEADDCLNLASRYGRLWRKFVAPGESAAVDIDAAWRLRRGSPEEGLS